MCLLTMRKYIECERGEDNNIPHLKKHEITSLPFDSLLGKFIRNINTRDSVERQLTFYILHTLYMYTAICRRQIRESIMKKRKANKLSFNQSKHNIVTEPVGDTLHCLC